MTTKTYPKFKVKKCVRDGRFVGLWGVQRPDGIRWAICTSQWEASALVYALNTATRAADGDWHKFFHQYAPK